LVLAGAADPEEGELADFCVAAAALILVFPAAGFAAFADGRVTALPVASADFPSDFLGIRLPFVVFAGSIDVTKVVGN
jgi:hypothetical protein